jgi:hypothetical protein
MKKKNFVLKDDYTIRKVATQQPIPFTIYNQDGTGNGYTTYLMLSQPAVPEDGSYVRT